MNYDRGPPPFRIPNYNQFFRSADTMFNEPNYDIASANVFKQPKGLKPNAIEKRLNQALQQPVDLGKGELMMKKMGWSGGGLGKSGEGIVEPIAPNAAYATDKQGLGKAEIQESLEKNAYALQQSPNQQSKGSKQKWSAKKEPKLVRSQFTKKLVSKAKKQQDRKALKMSVLEQLLDFVRCETEVELLLDKALTNADRKTVHALVEEISCGNFYGDAEQWKVARDIMEYNDFYLHTESSGDPKNRQLGVYKDAKEYMFLVIPEDLRDEEAVDQDEEIDDDDLIDWVEDPKANDEMKQMEKCDMEMSYLSLFKKPEFPDNEKFKKQLAEEEQKLVFKDELAKNVSKKLFTVTEVLEKVVEYFIDFVNDDAFTEFRFLGSFNENEYEAVGTFFDICAGAVDESEVAGRLREAMVSDKYCYSLGINSNGTTILLKEKKS